MRGQLDSTYISHDTRQMAVSMKPRATSLISDTCRFPVIPCNQQISCLIVGLYNQCNEMQVQLWDFQVGELHTWIRATSLNLFLSFLERNRVERVVSLF